MNPKPFLKWAGGKTQLLPELLKHVPTDFETYYEPFLGGGALLFELQPKRAVIADINWELVNVYEELKSNPTKVTGYIDSFPIKKEFFYKLRELDRVRGWDHNFDWAWRAARMMYLNKTCYNGLWRVNKKGENNTPWGYYSNPTIYELDNIHAVSSYLNTSDVDISSADFQNTLSNPTTNDFVYLDPPYDILNDTSNFTGYSAGGFSKGNHEILKQCVDSLTKRNVKVLQSNADTPFIRDLYADYHIVEVQAKRSINSKGNRRGSITELLIKNY